VGDAGPQARAVDPAPPWLYDRAAGPGRSPHSSPRHHLDVLELVNVAEVTQPATINARSPNCAQAG